MKKQNETLRFGDLVVALFDEASKVTSDKKEQTELAFLALMDMQNRNWKFGPTAVRTSQKPRLPH